jgi:hypothetical protein
VGSNLPLKAQQLRIMPNLPMAGRKPTKKIKLHLAQGSRTSHWK